MKINVTLYYLISDGPTLYSLSEGLIRHWAKMKKVEYGRVRVIRNV